MTDDEIKALAEELRHRADSLRADLSTMTPDEMAAAVATLHWLDDLLEAIANRDDAKRDDAKRDELLRQGEAAVRLLRPERSDLN
jgi:hypothetical protein